ncbi:diguanylate cyclase [Phaeovibrio sulfidiphilus]|uniref:diguanylate cyclase n=1 Tax=Phaeovibrio sulfidiphilus TaxID=1220600 RepID=A0A8J6YMI6_9PROT|nr:diguanylate cyclase [Phaeovibrio sulfidiphilus]MBE1237315.1 diguanylate cyclase [Phaeovibrio sulfidiphilus]
MESRSDKFQLGLKTRIFLGFLSFLLLLFGTVGIGVYYVAMDELRNSVKSRLKFSAAVIGQALSASDLEAIRSPEAVTNPHYQAVLRQLRVLRDLDPDIAYLYILRLEAGRVFFVVDTDEGKRQALPGTEYVPEASNLYRGFTAVAVDDAPAADEWGVLLSGYAPLKGGEGRYLVGIDMRGDTVMEQYATLKLAALLGLFVSIIVAVLFARFLASQVMRPIDRTVEKCEAIAAGNLNVRLTDHTYRELGRLFRSFNKLAEALARTKRSEEAAFEKLRTAKEDMERQMRQWNAELRELNERLVNESAERRSAQTELEKAVVVDELTRLVNRRGMIQRLGHEVLHSRQSRRPFTLLLLDMDDFKQVNDTLGHDAGDMVLSEVAIRIKGLLRGQDVTARWGGDEFVIMLADTRFENGLLVAEKIRSRIKDSPFFAGGQEVRVSVSIGVAEYEGEYDVDQVLRRVDEALYRAKLGGRNKVMGASNRDEIQPPASE